MMFRSNARRGRGYTVLEVTIVAALSSVLLIGTLRWLVGLGGVVNANLNTADNATLLRAAEQFGTDVTSAVHCEASGADARMREITDTRVAMVTSDGGTPVSVVWKIQGSLLQRGQAAMGPGCTFTEPGAWTTWSNTLSTADSLFEAVTDGSVLPDGTNGICNDEWSTDCQVDAVSVTLQNTGDEYTAHKVYILS